MVRTLPKIVATPFTAKQNMPQITAPSAAPKSETAVITPSQSQISDQKEEIITTHRQPPKAIRCELGKTSESSEQLANFFDGAVVSTSHIDD